MLFSQTVDFSAAILAFVIKRYYVNRQYDGKRRFRDKTGKSFVFVAEIGEIAARNSATTRTPMSCVVSRPVSPFLSPTGCSSTGVRRKEKYNGQRQMTRESYSVSESVTCDVTKSTTDKDK